MKLMERFLGDARIHEYPPDDLPEARKQLHLKGIVTAHECLCCFGDHYTSDCPVFPLAEFRRLLFAIRGLCLMCRRRHEEGQTCCFIYLIPDEFPLCDLEICKALPKHHRCICSNYQKDREKQGEFEAHEGRG